MLALIRDPIPIELLSDVELRVILVVADQTMGWIEDPETKQRKEKDWIAEVFYFSKSTKLVYKLGKS